MALLENPSTPELVSISTFISDLQRLPDSTFDDAVAMYHWVRAHPVDPDSMTPYFTWDRQNYTRNLIDKTPLYELLAICWEVGQGSSIHNHRDQNCWMAVPVGKLLVDNYRVLFQDLDVGKCKVELSGTQEMNPGNPAAVDPREPVHRVRNPAKFNERAVSLHLYSRPYDNCVVYSQELGTCRVIELQYTTEYGRK